MNLKKIIDAKSVKEMAIATFYYTSGVILGPLLLLGGLGYFFDHKFNTGPKYLIIGVVSAFVVTNVLLFKIIGEVNRRIRSHAGREKNNEDQVPPAADENKDN